MNPRHLSVGFSSLKTLKRTGGGVLFTDLDKIDAGTVGGWRKIELGKAEVEAVAGRSADAPQTAAVRIVR